MPKVVHIAIEVCLWVAIVILLVYIVPSWLAQCGEQVWISATESYIKTCEEVRYGIL